MKVPAWVLYLCFFLSGGAALVYEIVWQRLLTLVFGLSTLSVAAVLAAFLAGMALGARLAGPLIDRVRRPLRVYALIELSIAALAGATLFAIPPLMQAFAALYAAWQPGAFGSNLIRFGLAFIAIGVPSLLIGATVPAMTRLVAERAGSAALGFGRAYAVNTAGAVSGVALAGFWLLPHLGAQQALLSAVAVNLLVAALAALADARGAPSATPGRDPAAPAPLRTPVPGPDGDAARLHPRFALVVAALAGAIALAYEVAWIRLLAVFTLNSVYVFSMVVSLYLAALALGAGLATLWMRAFPGRELTLFSVSQLLQALAVPVLLTLAPRAAQLGLTSGARAPDAIFLAEYGLVAAVVFPPTLLIGVTLPLLAGMCAPGAAGAGRLIGRLYAWNACGTIAGATLTGALLIPLFGLRGSLLLLASANLALVAAAAAAGGTSGALRVLTPAGAAAYGLLVALLPGAVRFHLPPESAGATVIYYAEGPSATVHVTESSEADGRHRSLYVDSKSVAGTYDEIVTDQKMLAHVPLLLHPRPERALTVGFGTGGTSYSMLQHKVAVDCVEIEPRVADAFRLFESQNRGLVGPGLDRRDFRLILDDARAWLHVADAPYDVIVTDLTSIQYRGNGNLYTAECFRLLQSRLHPDGIGAAWVPITGITPEALKVLVRTFHSVFPHTSVWYMINLPTDFVILVGTSQPLSIPLGTLHDRMAAPLVARDLAAIGMNNAYKIAAGLLLVGDDVGRYAGPGPLHTDDRPLLDYLTHATPYHNTFAENMTELLAARSDTAGLVTNWPDEAASGGDPSTRWRTWRAFSEHLIRGHVALRSPTPDRDAAARAAYAQALELIPDDERTQALLAGLAAE